MRPLRDITDAILADAVTALTSASVGVDYLDDSMLWYKEVSAKLKHLTDHGVYLTLDMLLRACIHEGALRWLKTSSPEYYQALEDMFQRLEKLGGR